MTQLTKFPSVVQDEGGSFGWFSASNIVADDGAMAYTVGPGSAGFNSNWLRLGFDFSAIPDGTGISGITVTLLGLHKTNAGTGGSTNLEYWDGAVWRNAGYFGLPATPTDREVALSTVVSQAVLDSWLEYGVRIRNNMQPGVANVQFLIDAVSVTVDYVGPSAPTVSAIAPAKGSAAGGTAVTLTGTGFQFQGQDVISGVTIGGVACTELNVLTNTTLTCVTGAHAAGAVDVVATNDGGSGTLAGGFTYLSVVDATVKIVKAGAVAGDNKASADLWPSSPAEKVYGAPDDLWGAALTIADINASNFGVVLNATVGAGAEARVDFVALRFHYSVPGLSDPASYLAVLRVDADRQTARPDLYQLPRNGFAIANDPQVDRRVSEGAEFRESRWVGPGMTIEKIFHSRELWLEASPTSGTPGVEVWARVDDGPEFQLQNAGGSAAVLRSRGPHEVYFPRGDQGRGYYAQIIYRVPELSGSLVAAEYGVRSGFWHVSCRPKVTFEQPFTLVLSQGEFEDKTGQKLSPDAQLQNLLELKRPGIPMIPYRDPEGGTGYCSVVDVSWREVVFKEGPKANVLVAQVKLRVYRFD